MPFRSDPAFTLHPNSRGNAYAYSYPRTDWEVLSDAETTPHAGAPSDALTLFRIEASACDNTRTRVSVVAHEWQNWERCVFSAVTRDPKTDLFARLLLNAGNFERFNAD